MAPGLTVRRTSLTVRQDNGALPPTRLIVRQDRSHRPAGPLAHPVSPSRRTNLSVRQDNDAMTIPRFGRLQLQVPSTDLLGPTVAAALTGWSGSPLYVAPIDPALSDTAAFCEHYDVPMAASANCVIVTGKRGGLQRWAAAVVLATTRADVNGLIRRRLDVRKVSFADTAAAVELTGMEYGGITPIGLPGYWPILVDHAVVDAGPVIIGSGIRASKILVDGAALALLPGAEVIDGLARTADSSD